IDYVVNTQEQDVKELVNSLTDGYGADVAFECSGAVPAAKQGLDVLRKKGQYAHVGIFADSEVSFDMEKVVQKATRVDGSRTQTPADWEPSLEVMNNGRVNAKAMVSHEFDITRWGEGYKAIKDRESIKVLLLSID